MMIYIFQLDFFELSLLASLPASLFSVSFLESLESSLPAWDGLEESPCFSVSRCHTDFKKPSFLAASSVLLEAEEGLSV